MSGGKIFTNNRFGHHASSATTLENMQPELKQQPIQEHQHLWTVTQISLASYFAGPMAGCYFLGRNFRELGLHNYAKRCYLVGIAGTILLMTILFLIPDKLIARIPPICIPIGTSSIIVSYASYYQKQLIKEKMEQGAKRPSYWWCFLIVFSFAVIQVPLYFFIPSFLQLFFKTIFSQIETIA